MGVDGALEHTAELQWNSVVGLVLITNAEYRLLGDQRNQKPMMHYQASLLLHGTVQY
jgi:hypothetical protein